MSARLDAAATVTLPAASASADPTHQRGVIFRVAHSTSSAEATAADIPKECRGRYWRFLSLGAHVQFGWLLDADGISGEDAAPTLVYGQLSATGTGHLAAAGTLIDGQPDHFYCPSNARGVVFISSAAPSAPEAFFEAIVSGDKTGR